MRAMGFLLLGVGLSWLLYALTLDTSVELPFGGRVQNLSLMEARRTHLMLSGGAIVVGVLLLGFGRMQRATDDDDDADYRDCPFCAEPVRVEALMCRHCRSALPAVAVDVPESDEEAEVTVGLDEDPDVLGQTYSYKALRAAAEAAERHQ
jgi:hypothetical protein